MMRVLVLANGSLFAFSVGTCLGEAGHEVDVIAAHRWCEFRFSRYCGKFVSIDPALLEGEPLLLIERIQEHCRRRRIEVVVPADFQFVALLAKYGERLKDVVLFPVPSPEAMQSLHNKWELSRVAVENGVNHPATELLESAEQIGQLAIEFPAIVKPLEGHSSIGVYEIGSQDDLIRLIADEPAGATLPVLVQEYIDGQDFDLTLLADHGEVVAWTIQRRGKCMNEDARFFFADDQIVEMGQRLMRATQYHGVIDFDLRIDGGTGVPYVTDGNPRFPGSLRYKLWAGVNFPQLGVLMSLGEDARGRFRPTEEACTDYTVSPKRLLTAMVRGRLTPPNIRPEGQGAWEHSLRDPLPHLVNSVYHSLRRVFEGPAKEVNVARRYCPEAADTE